MRIAVNTRLLLPGTLEGIGRFTHEVMSRMTQTHPEVEFYFFFDREFDQKFLYGKNVKPVVLGPQARHAFAWYWWFEKSIYKAIEQHKIDVFLSPELYCSISSKIPSLMVAHDVAYLHYPKHFPIQARKYLKYFVPRFIQRANLIACVSENTRKDLIANFGVPDDKIFVTYNGPTSGYHPLSPAQKLAVREKITDGRPYFVYIGSMHPRKNVDRLIEAFNYFKQKNPKSSTALVLVGRMAWKSKAIRKAYEESPFKNEIILTGQRKQAFEIVGAAEALLYVSLFEGFGIPILEGFSADVPVITSNRNSMAEVAGSGAILVDPTQPREIAAAMTRILAEKGLSDQLIKAGRNELKRFSWNDTSEKIFNKLKNLAEKRAM